MKSTASKFELASPGEAEQAKPVLVDCSVVFVTGLVLKSFNGNHDKVTLRSKIVSHLTLLKPPLASREALPDALKPKIEAALKYQFVL